MSDDTLNQCRRVTDRRTDSIVRAMHTHGAVKTNEKRAAQPLWNHAIKFARWQHPAVGRGTRFTVSDSKCFRVLLSDQ